jgi:hypothetical protein
MACENAEIFEGVSLMAAGNLRQGAVAGNEYA